MTIDEQLREIARHADEHQRPITVDEIAHRASVHDPDEPPAAKVGSLSDDEGRHHRLRRVVAVAAAIALLAVGVAVVQSREREPNVATGMVDGDDQALADAAVLTAEDVGAGRDRNEGWVAASPEQEAQRRAEEDTLDDALADCLGMDQSELQADRATASALFVSEDNRNPEHLASKATVFSSAAEAHVVMAGMGQPAAQRCYGESITQQILERARDGLVTMMGRPLSVDDLEVRSSNIEALDLEYYAADGNGNPEEWPVADDYTAFVLKVTLAAEDAEVDVYTVLAFVTRGRVAVQLSARMYFFASSVSSVSFGTLTKQILDRLPVDPEAQVVGAPELPDPGEQPADAASAEEQVRLVYTGIFDSSSTPQERSRFSERPNVWIAANQGLEAGEYAGYLEGMSAVVDEVVFISPTRAAVHFQLSRPGGVPVPQSVEIGDAVLVDGRWLVGIDTTCALVSMADVECDMSL